MANEAYFWNIQEIVQNKIQECMEGWVKKLKGNIIKNVITWHGDRVPRICGRSHCELYECWFTVIPETLNIVYQLYLKRKRNIINPGCTKCGSWGEGVVKWGVCLVGVGTWVGVYLNVCHVILMLDCPFGNVADCSAASSCFPLQAPPTVGSFCPSLHCL